MIRLFARFLLPALLFAAGLFFLLQATGARPFLSYFLAAVFLGMGIASVQHAWKKRSDRE
ncbi:MAG: hypothetical protein WD314_11225 [Trueperaceae bacterium]